MVRTQISLDDEEMAALRRLAHERGVSIASLVRDGVQRVLDDAAMDDRWARALTAIGSVSIGGGVTNLSVEHDVAFDDALDP